MPRAHGRSRLGAIPTAIAITPSAPAGAGCRTPSYAPALAALITWLVCVPAAFALPGAIDLSPFGERAAAVPLVAGAVLLGCVALLHRRRPADAVIAGVAVGAFAGWVLLTMRTGLHGSPFGFLDFDSARLSAMAERYTTTWHSADGIVARVPSEYPPLFPWLVGRLSVLTGDPAWRLIGPAGTCLASAVPVAGFLLWRRIATDWLALGLAVVVFISFPAPAKPYEWMALELSVPWALAAFGGPRGRPELGWLAAGVIGGVQVCLYQGFVMFLAPGIAALVITGWRARSGVRRAAYGRHVLGVIAVAGAVSAPFLVPYLGWALAHGLQMTDRFQDPLINASPFPFLSVSVIGGLTAVGLAGLIVYRRSEWWAAPLLWLLLGVYAFRLLGELQFIDNGQTSVFQYTVHAITALLAAAGLFTVATAAPALARRARFGDLRMLGLAGLVLWAAMIGWSDWIPGASPPIGADLAPVLRSGYAPGNAFLAALPDGSYPRYAPVAGRWPWFPVDPVLADVRAVRGPRAAPLTLSFTEQLYAFTPWPGFVGVGANAAPGTEHWFSRVAELRALSEITVPAVFARASARTPWGAIDAFVLQADGAKWDWTPVNGPGPVHFSPAQFSGPDFRVFRGLPDGAVLAVRRSGR